MASSGEQTAKERRDRLMSRTALVLGAAGLFLFIVGVKRRHRLDPERDIGEPAEPKAK